MSVLLLGFTEDHFDDTQKGAIAEAAVGLELIYSRDKADITTRLDDIEVAVGGFPKDLLAQAPKLRWFQQWGAGADWLLEHPEVAEKDFLLTNVSGIHAVPISEHIFAFLLAFARSFPRATRDQFSATWSQSEGQPEPTFELAGKTMLLLGTGAIGARTAQLAQAFGMRVVGMRRNADKKVEHIDEMASLDALGSVLPTADVVVLTLPLTRDTHYLIGEAELRAFKDTALLINIGRGGLIDESALARALQEGWLAGAGLDVFETEPLPDDSPLWSMENVIITPHTSGNTPHYDERALEIFLENLRRYQGGEPLTHLVDKRLGY